MSIEFYGNPFGPSFVETMIPITGTHDTAGLQLQFDSLCGLSFWYTCALLASVDGDPAFAFPTFSTSTTFPLTMFLTSHKSFKHFGTIKPPPATCALLLMKTLSLLLDFLNSTLINFVTCGPSHLVPFPVALLLDKDLKNNLTGLIGLPPSLSRPARSI